MEVPLPVMSVVQISEWQNLSINPMHLDLFSWLTVRGSAVGCAYSKKQSRNQLHIDGNKSVVVRLAYNVRPAFMQCLGK